MTGLGSVLRCLFCIGLLGCGDSAAPQVDASSVEVDAGPQMPAVQIGVPDEITGLQFEPLEPGGDIPLDSFGQGGTHASLAVRCLDIGRKAYVDVTLKNLDTGEEITSPPSSRPALLLCRDEADRICDNIPLFVMTGGLAEPEEKDGLHIEVTATARTEDGEVTVTASVDGYLRRR